MNPKSATRRNVTAARPDEPKDTPPSPGGIQIERSITILAPLATTYEAWHQFASLPRFMKHLISVRPQNETTSLWTAKGPQGKPVEWEAELIEDLPNERISWRTLQGSDVEHAGSVRFREAPHQRGTEVTVMLTYNPPAGKVGSWVAALYGEEPSQQIAEDLHRLKALLETGEIPTPVMRPENEASYAMEKSS